MQNLTESDFQPKFQIVAGKRLLGHLKASLFNLLSSYPGRKSACTIISIRFNPKQWRMIFRGLPCDAAGCSPVNQSMDRTVNLVRGWLTPSQGASCAVTSAPTTPSEACCHGSRGPCCTDQGLNSQGPMSSSFNGTGSLSLSLASPPKLNPPL